VRGFTNNEIATIRYLLYPYKVQITDEFDDADVVVGTNDFSDFSKPLVKVSTRSTLRDLCENAIDDGNGIAELPSVLIQRCTEKFTRVLNPKIAFTYKVATRMAFRYNLIPSSIRSWFLRKHDADLSLTNHLTNEIARKALVDAFRIIGLRLERKRPPALFVTHDIDTAKGLDNAPSLKAIEETLAIQSIWFLPSDEYPISGQIAKQLVDGSTIGSHDVRHDGRLIHIKKHDELVERLTRSKLKLQDIFGTSVKCFRAPLLQCSQEIVAALNEAGYEADFSIPCWEPAHPSSMGGFGIESVHDFEINGVIEHPLTLFQDHQVLFVLRMSTHEAIKFWMKQAEIVHALQGDIVLLIHPDFSFSQELDAYKELLKSLQTLSSSEQQFERLPVECN
jgi:peptidoglycan/xylan/chitin deacetylase (PgdA/CDA1 family)